MENEEHLKLIIKNAWEDINTGKCKRLTKKEFLKELKRW